jgi:hypothetical protein
MKIATYHKHDVGSFLHAGALAFHRCPELTPQTTPGADVVMQSGFLGMDGGGHVPGVKQAAEKGCRAATNECPGLKRVLKKSMQRRKEDLRG